MSATEVIIQFVGLCLFSAGVPNDPGVHAILPRITSGLHEHATDVELGQASTRDARSARGAAVTEESASQVRRGATPAPPAGAIEPHVTMLVFHKDLVDNDSQWPVAMIPGGGNPLKDYRQVTLNGEHVTFLAHGVNPPLTSLPALMPRFSCPLANGNPALLTSGYQFPYAAAAAVVDIPEGVLEACRPGAVAATRVDTKLTLNTSGKLTVVAMKPGAAKVLILKTTTAPRIYFLNVPNLWAAGNQTASSIGEKHYVAYYRMIGKDVNSACSGPPAVPGSLSALPSCSSTGSLYRMASANPTISLVANRDAKPLGPLAGPPKNEVFDPDTANSECSNSAWP